MANVLQQSGRVTTSQAASTTTFYFAGSGPSLIANATETNRQVIVRMIFTMSKLYINVIANDRGASTLRVRINTANGNQSASITASTTGKFEDVVNTDTLASGDVFNYQLATGAGGTTFVIDVISHVSTPSVNTFQKLVTNIGAAILNNDFLPVSGAASGSTEAGMETKIFGNGGTFKNLGVFVSANTRDGDCTVTLRKTGVSQALTVTIPATTAGTFEDLVNTVSYVANDLVAFRTTRAGAAGACFAEYVSVSFETTDNTFLVNSFGTTTLAASGIHYYPISGSTSLTVSTESQAQAEARIPFTLSKLRVFVATNTIVAASTVTFRKNSANGNQVVSITGLTNGAFEDAANTDSVVATDLLDSQFTGGAGGTNLLLRNITYLATSQSGIGGGSTLLLMGVG